MATLKVNVSGVIVEKDFEEVSKAVEAGEEIELKPEGLVIYNEEDFNSFKTNLANEEYAKGKLNGVEMEVKKAREKLGLEFEGKNVDKLIDAYKSKLQAELNQKPDARIKELEADLNKIRGNYSTLETDFTQYKDNVQAENLRHKKDSFILGLIPDAGLKVDKDIVALALKSKMGVDVDFVDGSVNITKNGAVVKDEKTLSPVDPSVFITEQIAKLGLVQKPTGGNGDGDNTGGAPVSGYDKFVKEMETNGISVGSAEFSIEMNKRIKDKTLVI